MTIQPVSSAQPVSRPQFSGWTASARTNTTASLTLQTKDGDTVRLSFAAQSTLQAGAASTGDASVSAYSRSDSVSLSVTAEGDLDKDELRDISKLLKQFAAGIRDTARGRPEKASERLIKHNDSLGSIAAYAVNISSEQSFEKRTVELLA